MEGFGDGREVGRTGDGRRATGGGGVVRITRGVLVLQGWLGPFEDGSVYDQAA